jgi:TPR repeat protein
VEASVHLIDDNGRADQRTRNKNRERYVNDAYKLLKKIATAAYPDAMFYLADCYGAGRLGLQEDPKEAFALYQSAAKLGHPESAYRLAVCCEMGQEGGGGTRRDPIKAVQWYRRAAALGDTPAMYKMGMILLKGLLGQQRNPREALSWLKRAAERADEDNPHALHELALLYENPQGNDAVIRDENYALELLIQAGELGYKFSQFRLGAAYEYGLLGCPVDARQSIFWYTRAAAQGEHQSELALSGWYLTGAEGILQQSDTEAYLWARKAAISGLAKAEYAMGYFSEVGIGVPANLDDAKRWYWKASCKQECVLWSVYVLRANSLFHQPKTFSKRASGSKISDAAAPKCKRRVYPVRRSTDRTRAIVL